MNHHVTKKLGGGHQEKRLKQGEKKEKRKQ